MKQPINILIILLVITLISGAVLIFLKGELKNVSNNITSNLDIATGTEALYSVYTPGCQMPISKVHIKFQTPLNKPDSLICKYKNRTIPLVSSDYTSIWVNKEAFATYEIQNGAHLICCYTELYQPKPIYFNETDTRFQLKNICTVFKEKVDIVEEFVQVSCSYNNENIYVDYFAFVPIKKDVEKRCDELSKIEDKLNVMMIGLDAVSRSNFHRKMRKSSKYLLSNMNAVEMLGYNKIYHNSFGSLMPILTGFNKRELDMKCHYKKAKYFDNCTFIWDDFKAAGYRTAYVEDSAYHNLLHPINKGFLNQPTDYFLLPFLKASEHNITYESVYVDYRQFFCTGTRLLYDNMLGYADKFLKAMGKRSFFGFFWSCTLTHDEFDYPYFGDETLLSFLKNINNHEAMNNTVLIILSDHGFLKFNRYLSIQAAQLESRQPLMYFVFPDWFINKYNRAIHNLRRNANNLITGYDLYDTIKDLINYSFNLNDNELNRRKNLLTSMQLPRGLSLFLKIPKSRTCRDAGIDLQYCSCAPRIDKDLDSPLLKYFAEHVMLYINEKVNKYSVCAEQHLTGIVDANAPHLLNIFSNETVDTRITISTSPGGTRYEATAIDLDRKYSNKVNDTFVVVEDVHILDEYRMLSSCIDDYKVEPFCYCKYER